MKKAQKGNDRAFLKLFQEYEADIYRIAYVYVKNQEDALDVVQEVAYQSFRKIDTLKNPAYFKTWLIRITINSAINVMKNNQRLVLLKPEFEVLIGTEDENLLQSLSLQEMMDVLREEEKSVVLLRFYHDHTLKEIAEILEIPLGTAKSILYRALKKLRKNYREEA